MIYRSAENSDSPESTGSSFFSRCFRTRRKAPPSPPSSTTSHRCRNCCIFLCCFLPLLGLLGLLFSSRFNSSVHSFGEQFESRFRASSAHDWINRLAFDHPMPKPVVKNHTIVYLHVPRTAGDSLRTHLFPSSAYGFEDRMLTDIGPSWQGYVGVPRFFPADCLRRGPDEYFPGIESCWPPIREFFMYKGFFSYEQIEWLRREDWKEKFLAHDSKGRKLLDIFTILRHPQEKLYSTVKHMINLERKQGTDGRGSRTICNGTVWEFLKQETDCEKPFPVHLEAKHATFLQNSLTFQLGHELDWGLRDKNLPAEQVLERAKEFLKTRMSFIGFFEDWDEDFDRLKHTIFDPLFEDEDEEAASSDHYSSSNNSNSTSKSYGEMNIFDRGVYAFWAFVREKLFLVGTFFGSSRLKVKKYSLASMGSDEERRLVEEYTKYDMELYRYARELTGRPVDALYDTYEEFFMHEILPKIIKGILVILGLVLLVRAYRRWKGGRGGSNSEVVEYELVDVHGMNESGLYSSEDEDRYENVVKYEEDDALP